MACFPWQAALQTVYLSATFRYALHCRQTRMHVCSFFFQCSSQSIAVPVIAPHRKAARSYQQCQTCRALQSLIWGMDAIPAVNWRSCQVLH